MTREEAQAAADSLAEELGDGWRGNAFQIAEDWYLHAWSPGGSVQVEPASLGYGAPYVATYGARFRAGGKTPRLAVAHLREILLREGERLTAIAISLPAEETK